MQQKWLEQLGDNVKIYVSNAYRFNTDSILLADFSYGAVGKRGMSAVDLGTGGGIIPLLWLTKEKEKAETGKFAQILGVEIQAEACRMAESSIQLNGWQNRVRIMEADFCRLKGRVPFGCYDLVCCNPPYKPFSGGIKNPLPAHKIARHEVLCTLQELVETAARLLRFGGKFCMCQRPERLCDVLTAMRKAGVEPKRLRFVQQRTEKAPNLFLVCGARGGNPGMEVLPVLQIEDVMGGFSREMQEIYGPSFFDRPAEEKKEDR